MRVAMVPNFGAPEVFQTVEVPDPVPAAGQAVVDVVAADVLWLETTLRSGGGREYFRMEPPYVPGGGIAGIVGRVGPGVDPALVGAPVAAYTGRTGGYAEQIAAEAADLVRVPDGLDLQVAAALLHDAVTALAVAEVTGLTGTDTVLVVGASGGLGIASVQLAMARGARVVATARDERKIARLRELGADSVVDSGRPDWLHEAAQALAGSADVVLDNIGGSVGEAAFGLVAPGGRFSAHGTPSGRFAAVDPDEARRKGITVTGIADLQLDDVARRRLTEEAFAEAVAGRLAPVIGQTFPLTKAADAHRAIEERTVFGKTLLLP